MEREYTVAPKSIRHPLGDENADGRGHDVVDPVGELKDDDHERHGHARDRRQHGRRPDDGVHAGRHACAYTRCMNMHTHTQTQTDRHTHTHTHTHTHL